MPYGSVELVESFNSVPAASTRIINLALRPGRQLNALRDRLSSAKRNKAVRKRLLACTISMVLVRHTVQVTAEAKVSAMSTALNTSSAFTNMPHGVRSRGNAALPATAYYASASAGWIVNAKAARKGQE